MTERMIINAKGAVFGRLCSYAAKQALLGKEVVVVNSEKAVISGNKNEIIARYKGLRDKGGFSQKGPRVSKSPYRLMKRGIRGMLPDFRSGQGKLAFARVKCYEGVPAEFEEKEMIKIKKQMPVRYIELKQLVERL